MVTTTVQKFQATPHFFILYFGKWEIGAAIYAKHYLNVKRVFAILISLNVNNW